MNDWLAVLLTVLLLAGNAFFVGAEFALITARRDRLEALVGQGKKRARTVIAAGEHLSLMLAGSQLGITICSILLGRVGEPAIAHLIETPMHALGVPDSLLHPIGFALALTIVVVLHILLGEMVPKNIAIAGPERSAMLLVPTHLLFMKVARPLIAFYNLCANLSLRLLRVEPKDELDVTVTELELSEMIGESRSEGLLDEEEHRRLTQALQTSGRTVADVTIPPVRGPHGPARPGRHHTRSCRAGRHRDRLLPVPGGDRTRGTGRLPAPEGRPRPRARRIGRAGHPHRDRRDPAPAAGAGRRPPSTTRCRCCGAPAPTSAESSTSTEP